MHRPKFILGKSKRENCTQLQTIAVNIILLSFFLPKTANSPDSGRRAGNLTRDAGKASEKERGRVSHWEAYLYRAARAGLMSRTPGHALGQTHVLGQLSTAPRIHLGRTRAPQVNTHAGGVCMCVAMHVCMSHPDTSTATVTHDQTPRGAKPRDQPDVPRL